MKKIAILYKNYSPIIDAIKYKLPDCEVDCLIAPTGMDKYDLIVNLGIEYEGEALACHYSLLPAFNSEEPVKEAILSGVKVTGITMYNTKSQKIVAQYPIFINNETHYDELEQELKYLEQTLFPLVIQKVINNEPFEVGTLMNHGCGAKCGGCSGCKH